MRVNSRHTVNQHLFHGLVVNEMLLVYIPSDKPAAKTPWKFGGIRRPPGPEFAALYLVDAFS